MKVTRPAWIVFGVALAGADLRLGGTDTKGPDPDLPQPLDPNLAAPLLESSPFTRAINLSESLSLTGIAYVQGKPVATLTDKRTKKNYLVSAEPNSEGWTLASAQPASQLRNASVKIMVGPEVVTIRYGDTQIAPGKTATGVAGPSRWPTDREAITMVDGVTYVRGSAYLSDADREKYYRGWSRESHDKFREVLRDNREMMLKASPQERAALAKKVFDDIDRQEQSRSRR